MKKIANRRIVNVFSAIVLLMACPAVMAQTKHNRFYIQPMAGTHLSWWHGEMGCYNENTGILPDFQRLPIVKYILNILIITIGKGQKLLQWENNIGNILSNSFGLINTAFGGKAQFDWDNLGFVYRGGKRDELFPKDSGFGSYAIFGPEEMEISMLDDTFTHEMHHLWQSRAMGDFWGLSYSAVGLSAVLSGGKFWNYLNYYEQIGYSHCWY